MTDSLRRNGFMLAVVAGAYVLSFFHRFAPAGIAQDLAVSFQTTAASLGVLAATYFYVYTIMQVPTGILVDTLGPRRILLMGAIIACVGSILFGWRRRWTGAGRTHADRPGGVGDLHRHAQDDRRVVRGKPFRDDDRHLHAGRQPRLGAGRRAAVTDWPRRPAGAACSSASASFSLLLGGCLLDDRARPPDGGSAAHRPRFDRTVMLSALLRCCATALPGRPALVNTGMSGAFFTFAGLWATPYLIQVHGMLRAVAASHLSLWFGGFAVGCFFHRHPVRPHRPAQARPHCRLPCLRGDLADLAVRSNHATLWLSYTLFGLMGLCDRRVQPDLGLRQGGQSRPCCRACRPASPTWGAFSPGRCCSQLFGWVMDLGWKGEMLNGARVYDLAAWRSGMLVIAASACCGALAAWWVKETRCRNIWSV
jgi:hypothetical protein